MSNRRGLFNKDDMKTPLMGAAKRSTYTPAPPTTSAIVKKDAKKVAQDLRTAIQNMEDGLTRGRERAAGNVGFFASMNPFTNLADEIRNTIKNDIQPKIMPLQKAVGEYNETKDALSVTEQKELDQKIAHLKTTANEFNERVRKVDSSQGVDSTLRTTCARLEADISGLCATVVPERKHGLG